jgi:hypothetical protein
VGERCAQDPSDNSRVTNVPPRPRRRESRTAPLGMSCVVRLAQGEVEAGCAPRPRFGDSWCGVERATTGGVTSS